MNQKEDVRAMMTIPRRVVTSESRIMMTAVTAEPSLLFGSLGYILIFKERSA